MTHYTVKSFAQAVYLLAHGHQPVRIAGGTENPVFTFAPEAREKGMEFIRSKNELSALVYAAVLDDAADSRGSRREEHA
jgi:hypothetical protein